MTITPDEAQATLQGTERTELTEVEKQAVRHAVKVWGGRATVSDIDIAHLAAVAAVRYLIRAGSE